MIRRIVRFLMLSGMATFATNVLADGLVMPLVPLDSNTTQSDDKVASADAERNDGGATSWRKPMPKKGAGTDGNNKQVNNTQEDTGPVAVTKDIKRIVAKKGVNEIVYISQGHVNRIVTPFQTPRVTTTSDAMIEARDNVLYLGTAKPLPVTLYITEKGTETPSVALTLIPKRIPTQEIFIELDGHAQPQGQWVNHEAARWETKQAYIDAIKTSFAKIAVGELPRGFAMHPLNRVKNLTQPYCKQPGLSFDWSAAQVVHGHRMSITIGLLTNLSPKSIEVSHNPCFGWDVSAVATWPNVMLAPGETVEVYVARRQNEQKRKRIDRPSLLMGATP